MGDVTGRTRIAATVRGHVQGVGFRYFVVAAAMRIGVDGWVANAPDGTVRCEAEGDGPAVAEFVQEIERGPAGAYVEWVDVAPMVPTGAKSGFEIRSHGHRGD